MSVRNPVVTALSVLESQADSLVYGLSRCYGFTYKWKPLHKLHLFDFGGDAVQAELVLCPEGAPPQEVILKWTANEGRTFLESLELRILTTLLCAKVRPSTGDDDDCSTNHDLCPECGTPIPRVRRRESTTDTGTDRPGLAE